MSALTGILLGVLAFGVSVIAKIVWSTVQYRRRQDERVRAFKRWVRAHK